VSNVKVLPPDAFELNCKMTYNDTAQIHQRVMRMWASAENPGDFELLDGLQDKLESILYLLKNRLDT
jgi:hypothetical protein